MFGSDGFRSSGGMEKRMVTEETTMSDHIYSQNSNIEMVTVTRRVLLRVYFDTPPYTFSKTQFYFLIFGATLGYLVLL